MNLLHRPHAVQHAIAHAAQFAARHHFHLHHHLHHHPHQGVLHVRRQIVHRADADAVQDLEQRVLMSAAHLAAFEPLLVGKAATTATATHAATTATPKAATPKATAPKATATAAPAGPAAVADPVTTDPGYVYKSFAADPLFAPAGPSINDVSQGELGDCYLLSVLSSVAKTDSALIRQTIVPNANGTYTVTFAGKAKVTVDSELPTLPDGQPAYAQLGAGNSLWVSLYEKAYADYVNPKADRYTTISGGWMGDAFSALGLKSSSTFASSSAASLATLVQKDLKGGDFVTLGTAAYVGPNSPLVSGHAYEIDSVTVDARGVVTAVTVRNPWGNDIANGGYVTVTAQQLYAAFTGLSVAHT